jgi:hypothetical protein
MIGGGDCPLRVQFASLIDHAIVSSVPMIEPSRRRNIADTRALAARRRAERCRVTPKRRPVMALSIFCPSYNLGLKDAVWPRITRGRGRVTSPDSVAPTVAITSFGRICGEHKRCSTGGANENSSCSSSHRGTDGYPRVGDVRADRCDRGRTRQNLRGHRRHPMRLRAMVRVPSGTVQGRRCRGEMHQSSNDLQQDLQAGLRLRQQNLWQRLRSSGGKGAKESQRQVQISAKAKRASSPSRSSFASRGVSEDRDLPSAERVGGLATHLPRHMLFLTVSMRIRDTESI